ncbi:MAG: glycosyltransferase family 4 protein, partial [bacterium]|nr:glycosyltransferase family 4 protein [bacterium]
MKIAIIESKLNGKGGSQRQALCLALELQNMGHRVTMYTLAYDKDKCFSDTLAQLNVVYTHSVRGKRHAIPFLGFLNYFRYSYQESKAAKALALLIDPDTDIVNAHDRLGFRVAAYAKKYVRPFPVVLMMSDILTKGWIAWRRAQFNKDYAPSLKQKLLNRLIDAYEVRKFILSHEKIVVLDNRTKQWVSEYFGKDAVVVRSGLDLETFPYIKRHITPTGQFSVFMAGIFFLHRRYEDAIQAVKILRDKGYDISLTIAGDNSANHEYAGYYKDLTVLTRELGLEGVVTFLGKISDDELISRYQHSDIYISPNHLQSWGLAVFEAMASGCPVIVSKTAGASEVLTDGENALLVPPKNP